MKIYFPFLTPAVSQAIRAKGVSDMWTWGRKSKNTQWSPCALNRFGAHGARRPVLTCSSDQHLQTGLAFWEQMSYVQKMEAHSVRKEVSQIPSVFFSLWVWTKTMDSIRGKPWSSSGLRKVGKEVGWGEEMISTIKSNLRKKENSSRKKKKKLILAI